MGLTDQRQRAKNITDYPTKREKKLPTTDRKNINRLPTWTDIIYIYIFFFQKQEYIVMIFSAFLGSNQRYQVTSLFTNIPQNRFAERMKISTKQSAQSYTLHARNAQINPQRKFFPVQWIALLTNPPYRDGHKDSCFLCKHFHVIY